MYGEPFEFQFMPPSAAYHNSSLFTLHPSLQKKMSALADIFFAFVTPSRGSPSPRRRSGAGGHSAAGGGSSVTARKEVSRFAWPEGVCETADTTSYPRKPRHGKRAGYSICSAYARLGKPFTTAAQRGHSSGCSASLPTVGSTFQQRRHLAPLAGRTATVSASPTSTRT